MIYFEEEKNYQKIKVVADKLGIEKQRVYECVRDIENYNLTRFKKTPFGSYLVEDAQIKLIKDYSLMKDIMESPRGAAEIIRDRQRKERSGRRELDMKWAKGLNYAIWRNF